ncbi:receptor-like protein 6 isoform X1 [Quercus robur]|uniref:receptor-like protein 6 isoform X1 n=1 Tax=Quercus robur TaxID=38942 RepID=UPI002163A96A|nr:receptor-like protein 6 isoform X1 [Quercus robur]
MGSSMCLLISLRLLFFLSIFHYLNSCSSLSTQPACKDFESSALLQFKQSFKINVSASSDPFAYPKISSWNSGERNDCCSWDGVLCDRGTGYVIGLDLSSSQLYGSFNSSSSLFHLVYLQKLNLADNHFNYSQIPPSIRYLSNLTYLNLSMSAFSGQIPPEIFELPNLVSLDLSFNPLKLQKPGLKSVVENFTSLKHLYLSRVNLSSPVPHILANLSSLKSLGLRGCELYGEFPMEIFKLRNLQILNVQDNENLTGYLPEFHSSNPLQILRLANTGFSGKLPDSIGNLKSLIELDINTCHFSGLVPTSLGNLTNLIVLSLSFNKFSGQIPFSLANLTQLSQLKLSTNSFSAQTLFWLGKQTKLTILRLAETNLYGDIPSSLKNLTQLTDFSVGGNQLTGQIPPWLGNLTQLTLLELGANKFHGSIPQSIYSLANLEYLSLAENNLSGRVDMDSFLKLKNLTSLQLSGIDLSFLSNSTFNASTSKLELLGLNACNLTEFPTFLRSQRELVILYLFNNKIQGQIPNWIFNIGKHTLSVLVLSSNFLTTFESFNHTPPILPWDNLLHLDLSSNKLQGSLPIPPPSISHYEVSNNKLTGEISPLFCNLSLIVTLDLSHNNFGGMLPQCLSKLSNLGVLNLQNNNFRGILPGIYMEESRLRAIDVSYNQLEGQVPRSLSNCTMLEILLLGNNQFSDTFPSWLGKLPRLRVLSLQSNGFHSAIGKPESSLDFPKLQIIDVSFNNFTGKLPYEHFQCWTSMKVANLTFDKDNAYMVATANTPSPYFGFENDFSYTLEMTNKGIKTLYQKIQDHLVAIDLSSNKFDGEISKVIGNLKGLHLLNISNNILTGPIPSSLENLRELESLDLSQNRLSGEIPPQLLQLTFLAFFNASNNHLTGPIPQGQQFSTFENDSYLGNTGLCGVPLTKKCKISKTLKQPPLNFEQGEGSNFPSKSDWVVIMMGYGSGLINGVIIGNKLTIRKLEWFLKTFGRKQ